MFFCNIYFILLLRYAYLQQPSRNDIEIRLLYTLYGFNQGSKQRTARSRSDH